MKKLLLIFIISLLSGCAGRSDEVLSSLLNGVYFYFVLIIVIIGYIIQGLKFLVGITPKEEKRNEKKKYRKKKSRIKKLKQEFSQDMYE